MPATTPISVAIVTTVRLYRDGLALAFAAEDGVEVVGTAGDAAVALRLARGADVVLLDMTVEDSLGLAHLLSASADVVALAIAETEASVIACAEAGAVGYVPRDASLADMTAVVRSVAEGEAV